MTVSTSIEWTDATWNPTRGCSRISEGCRNCYAERQLARFSGPGQYAHGFAERTASGPKWTGRVELVPSMLDRPLRWQRPRRIFVNSTSDLFHGALSDDAIDRVFAVMALARRHTFQVLTKRPLRMLEYLTRTHVGELSGQDVLSWPHRVYAAAIELVGEKRASIEGQWGVDDRPLRNVWLGVSVEDQKTADERIPALLETPAAVRFVSAEPLLGPVDLMRFPPVLTNLRETIVDLDQHGVDWVIVGGESGPGARPCDVAWIRSVRDQCATAAVPCFVKQLGAHATDGRLINVVSGEPMRGRWRHPKGGDPAEWPEDLRVRQFPASPESTNAP